MTPRPGPRRGPLARLLLACLLFSLGGTAARADDRDIPLTEAYRVFNLPTAESLAAEGYEGVRVFLVDGFGRHQPAVAVLRKGTTPPEISAWVKQDDKVLDRMVGEGRDWDWRTVQLLMDETRAAPIEQAEPTAPRPVKSPVGDDEEEEVDTIICMDSWTTMVEVIQAGVVTRRRRSSCGEDVVYDGAGSLLSLAAQRIPGCDSLRISNGWPVDRLNRCSRLGGEERSSAADLANILDGPEFSAPIETTPSRLRLLIEPGARLDLPGQAPVQGPEAIAAWIFKEASLREAVGLQADSISVTDRDGRVVGGVYSFNQDDQSYFWAPSEQIWREDNDHGWRLVRWTVGPFEERHF